MQICVSCNQELPFTAFEKQKNRPNHRKQCKTCRYKARDKEKEYARHRIYSRERRKNNPDIVRQSWEKTKYGITKEEIGIKHCMICKGTKRLSIDHNHKTEKYRGLLCHNCNIGLGNFKDNVELLEKAIQYLKLDRSLI